MFIYKSKTALITGASSGLGKTFARALAQRGMNVLLVARSKDKLQAVAADLSRQYRIRAEVIAADLREEGAALAVYEATRQLGLSVDLLINNAGVGAYGSFETISLTEQHETVTVNVMAVIELTRAFVPTMLARGEGAVINVSSTAAFQPISRMTVYAASKAFVLSFSEALWAEYRNRGIHVLALCPGSMQTPFDDTLGEEYPTQQNRLTPERVVTVGLRALEQRQHYIIVGSGNYLLANLPRLLPRAAVARILEGLFRPRRATASPPRPSGQRPNGRGRKTAP